MLEFVKKNRIMSEKDMSFADQVFHQFLDLLRFKRQYGHRFIEEHGIKPRDLSILLFLSEIGGATVGQTQAYLHQSASTTSALIAKLEKSELVTRTRLKEDNRVVQVELTKTGRQVIENTPLGGLPLLRRNMRQLSEERLTQINDVLVEIMQMMEVNN
ncbi:MAG: MarR family transcriptional regulator [Chloroflexi bacterium]|nr:MAG: MarR family transcriptional regulator [Chloroflexota bacterium]